MKNRETNEQKTEPLKRKQHKIKGILIIIIIINMMMMMMTMTLVIVMVMMMMIPLFTDV